jgi:hypothetical protein
VNDISNETHKAGNNVDEYVMEALSIISKHEELGKRHPSVESLVLAITIESGVNKLLAALVNNK